jgi:hypothetical protein
LRAAEFIADDVKDLHPYGLDEPGREVTLYTGDKSKTLQFGKALTNDATKVYARLKGTETVFTVAVDTAQKFAVQPNELRDPQILGFDAAAVSAISIPPIELRLDSNKLWNVTAPKPLPTDQERVKELLNQLSYLAATQFVADVATDLGRYGLVTPAATVSLHGQGTNVLAQLLVSAPAAEPGLRYVKRADEPFVYGVATSAMDWLPRSPIAFRKRQVAEFKPAEVTGLTIDKAGKTVTLAKDKEGKWSLVRPTEGVLDMDTLNQVLEALSTLEAREYVAESSSMANPEIKLAIKLGDKNLGVQVGPQAPNGDRPVAWSEPALLFTTAGYNLTPLLRDLVTAPAATPAPAPAPGTNAIPPAPKSP